jgi:hypothetical protein
MIDTSTVSLAQQIAKDAALAGCMLGVEIGRRMGGVQ